MSKKTFYCNDDFNRKMIKNILTFEKEIINLMKNHKFNESKMNHLNNILNKSVFIVKEKRYIQTCMKLEKGE